ncbi:SMP-30/gluconolactonase/LRE family protein [Geodermatophilus marinus]|uniref:SMP-30/gluconolactonase/LRE family protein n=1 Tax=Geodermatophilus sp. LHW52908 TaxID=2303986 RepID=UPI000E3CE76D|nr:superoxide dismutase [Geodermatophilus sp. LHW52908]RFU21124.1 superoxide dismutase [Geodermatophilus sp. LHW52908]
MRARVLTVLTATVLGLTGGAVGAAPAGADGGGWFPDVIPLPAGFQPEGIATGRGPTFYVGSLADGAIYRGSLRTGEGSVLVEGVPGRVAVGVEVDRRGRLWVAGGDTGTGRVHDTRTGDELASWSFATAGFVNDVVVTRDAAYFTDSLEPVLHVVPLGPHGEPGEATTLPLTGEIEYTDGFNANGIEASPDGRTLLVVQSNTGLLFAVDAATGEATRVDLGGASLTNGDGLLRRGSTLHVVRNRLDEIAVVRLDPSYRSGTVVDTLTDPDFDVPTTVAGFRDELYAVNARFGTPPTPETTYTVVRVDGS